MVPWQEPGVTRALLRKARGMVHTSQYRCQAPLQAEQSIFAGVGGGWTQVSLLQKLQGGFGVHFG